MVNNQSLYFKENGTYYYKDSNGETLFKSDVISVLYDLDGILLKHGSPDNLKIYFERYKKMQSLDPDLFKFRVVSTDKWKVDELNKMLTHSGYVSYLDTDPNRFQED